MSCRRLTKSDGLPIDFGHVYEETPAPRLVRRSRVTILGWLTPSEQIRLLHPTMSRVPGEVANDRITEPRDNTSHRSGDASDTAKISHCPSGDCARKGRTPTGLPVRTHLASPQIDAASRCTVRADGTWLSGPPERCECPGFVASDLASRPG